MNILLPFWREIKMGVPIIGTVPLSSAAANVVHRNVTIVINGGTPIVKDMITDNTFTCSEGDNYWIQCQDVDTYGSVSLPSNIQSGIAQTPPPTQPSIGNITFVLA